MTDNKTPQPSDQHRDPADHARENTGWRAYASRAWQVVRVIATVAALGGVTLFGGGHAVLATVLHHPCLVLVGLGATQLVPGLYRIRAGYWQKPELRLWLFGEGLTSIVAPVAAGSGLATGHLPTWATVISMFLAALGYGLASTAIADRRVELGLKSCSELFAEERPFSRFHWNRPLSYIVAAFGLAALPVALLMQPSKEGRRSRYRSIVALALAVAAFVPVMHIKPKLSGPSTLSGVAAASAAKRQQPQNVQPTSTPPTATRGGTPNHAGHRPPVGQNPKPGAGTAPPTHNGGGSPAANASANVVSWQDACGPTAHLPGYDVTDETVSNVLLLAFIGPGAPGGVEAGCTGRTHVVHTTEGVFYWLEGWANGRLASVAVYSVRYGPAIFLAPAAEVIRTLIRRYGILGGSPRIDAGNGDVYLVYVPDGTIALVRDQKVTSDGLAQKYVVLWEPLADDWYSDMTEHAAWRWPIVTAGSVPGHERLFFVDDPVQLVPDETLDYDQVSKAVTRVLGGTTYTNRAVGLQIPEKAVQALAAHAHG